ncbi:MAG: hypothetical protein AAB834_06905 [Patescibacteria group bacterium]
MPQSGEYNYRDDIFASPDQVAELVRVTKAYLFSHGEFSWDEFYGFGVQADGAIDPTPLVGGEYPAPKFEISVRAAKTQRISPSAAAILAIHGLKELRVVHQEGCRDVRYSEDTEESVYPWSLGFSIGPADAPPGVGEFIVAISDDDENDDLDTAVLHEGDQDFLDLKYQECLNLQAIIVGLQQAATKKRRRRRWH